MNQFMGNALHKNRAVVRSEIHPLVSFNFYAPRILPEKSNCIHSKAQNQKSSLLPMYILISKRHFKLAHITSLSSRNCVGKNTQETKCEYLISKIPRNLPESSIRIDDVYLFSSRIPKKIPNSSNSYQFVRGEVLVLQ